MAPRNVRRERRQQPHQRGNRSRHATSGRANTGAGISRRSSPSRPTIRDGGGGTRLEPAHVQARRNLRAQRPQTGQVAAGEDSESSRPSNTEHRGSRPQARSFNTAANGNQAGSDIFSRGRNMAPTAQGMIRDNETAFWMNQSVNSQLHTELPDRNIGARSTRIIATSSSTSTNRNTAHETVQRADPKAGSVKKPARTTNTYSGKDPIKRLVSNPKLQAIFAGRAPPKDRKKGKDNGLVLRMGHSKESY